MNLRLAERETGNTMHKILLILISFFIFFIQ
jgi:hypothetical protein